MTFWLTILCSAKNDSHRMMIVLYWSIVDKSTKKIKGKASLLHPKTRHKDFQESPWICQGSLTPYFSTGQICWSYYGSTQFFWPICLTYSTDYNRLSSLHCHRVPQEYVCSFPWGNFPFWVFSAKMVVLHWLTIPGVSLCWEVNFPT